MTPYVLGDALWAAETEGSYYRFLIHVGDQDRPQEFGRVLSTQRRFTEPQRRGTQLPNGASSAGPSAALQAKTTAANSRIVAKMILVSETTTCRAHSRRPGRQNASWHLAF